VRQAQEDRVGAPARGRDGVHRRDGRWPSEGLGSVRVVDDDVVTGARERRRDAPSHVAVTDHAHLQVPPPTDDAVSPQEAPWQHLGERSTE